MLRLHGCNAMSGSGGNSRVSSSREIDTLGDDFSWCPLLAPESLEQSPVLLEWRLGELEVGNPAVRRKMLSIELVLNSGSDDSGAIDGHARLERNKRFELAASCADREFCAC